jgi:hypothetical protein
MRIRFSAIALCGLLGVSAALAAEPDWANGFVRPPDAARPWVYWFWLNSNISSNGVTADLEAMKRAGIGGVLIMEVDQGAPVGPVPFMSPAWRDMFRHVAAEAQRLGLERRGLEWERRTLDQARAIDAESRLERDEPRRPAALRRGAPAAPGGGRLLS